MYESNKIAEVIKVIAKQKGVQLKTLLLELKLNKNTFSHMYNGSMIAADSLARIADYLNVSVDYLLGRTKEQIPQILDVKRDRKRQIVVDNFNKLNATGQDKLVRQSEIIAKNSDYTTPDEEMVTVVVAARSKNNDFPVQEMQIPKSKFDLLVNLEENYDEDL